MVTSLAHGIVCMFIEEEDVDDINESSERAVTSCNNLFIGLAGMSFVYLQTRRHQGLNFFNFIFFAKIIQTMKKKYFF